MREVQELASMSITRRRALTLVMALSASCLSSVDASVMQTSDESTSLNPKFCELCSFQPLPRFTRRRCSTARRYRHEPAPAVDSNETVENTNTGYRDDSEMNDPIADWKPPPPHVVHQTIEERIKPLRRLTSPVFFSTNSQTCRRVRGLGQVPSRHPLLIVGNHQLGGLDIWLIVPELIEQRGMFVRGLGHPVIFQDAQAHLNGGPTFLPDSATAGKEGTFGLYQKFGAVMVSPRNLYRLLESGGPEAILHFPGGAREAYHGRKEAHELFWPTRLDFVRMAAKFNATIVPLAGVGAADSVYFVADPEHMLELPFGLGDAVSNSFLTVRQAARYDEQDKDFIRPPPFILPKILPARHYFLFGKAFETTKVDSCDREACRKLYQDVKKELECGLKDLLRARQRDPYQGSFTRFVYEQVTGKQAPTFSVKELNVDE
jgi:hypothetical protein